MVGLIYIVIGKIGKKKDNRLTGYKILKEWMISSLLFVQMHLNISISLGVNYSNHMMTALAFGGIIEVLLVLQVILYLKRPKNFG